MSSIKVSDLTWSEEVINSDVPVVVDIYADWCGPCKQIGPAIEELSEEYGNKVKFVKVDADNNPNTLQSLGVRGIPALFIFKNGKSIASKTGAMPKTQMKEWIDDYV